MLGLSRYCSATIGKNSLVKFFPIRQSLHTQTSDASINGRSFVLLNRTPTSFTQGLFRSNEPKAFYSTRAPYKPAAPRYISIWYTSLTGLCLGSILFGGITRLTESGLSMVTWKPLGEKMPTSKEQWIEEFERYQQYPEFKIKNAHITLEEFKRIWWMEYLHRSCGRLLGGIFLLPATYFWAKGSLTPVMKVRVLAMGALIGIQGLMGWYMVKSGLEDRFHEPSDVPRVSQYRLAAHLGLAFVLYTGLLYSTLEGLIPVSKSGLTTQSASDIGAAAKKMMRFKRVVYLTKGFAFVTALSGAFVAGMDAGLIYNTFPKMANKWIPDDIFALSPRLRNFTENPATVQFDHRILAMSTLGLITYLGIMSRNFKLPRHGKKAVTAILCAGYLQVVLGISTLLTHVPVALGSLHQFGSLTLLSSVIWLCHELKHLKYIPK